MLRGARSSPVARRRLAAAPALALALLLACCSGSGGGGSQDRAATASAAASPSASASSSERPPALPAAARSKGRAGQRAFARHVMDVWGYALRTNDARPLTALGAGKKPCGGCGAFARTLASRRTQGWAVDFPGLRVRSLEVSATGGQAVARARVDVPQSDSYNDDGSFRNTSPAHKGASFVVRLRYAGKAYRLESFTVS
jgi:hypothetical protein